jgi:type I restriction enzyme M protein
VVGDFCARIASYSVSFSKWGVFRQCLYLQLAKEHQLNKNKDWKDLNLKIQLDRLKALQQQFSGNPDEDEPGLLHETDYFWKQAHWLQSRFPGGVYTDVEGLCKVVN